MKIVSLIRKRRRVHIVTGQQNAFIEHSIRVEIHTVGGFFFATRGSSSSELSSLEISDTTENVIKTAIDGANAKLTTRTFSALFMLINAQHVFVGGNSTLAKTNYTGKISAWF